MGHPVYCNLTLVGDGFDSGSFGIVTSKDWLYIQDLDVSILSLRESGALDTLKETWFDKQNCPTSSETSTAMTIISLAGLFVIFAIICGLSILLFAWARRREIKKFLFKLVGRKMPSTERKYSVTKESIKTPEPSQNYQVASVDFSNF